MKVVFVTRSTILAVPGGDTIQMKNTAKALNKFGVHVDFYQGESDFDFKLYDLIHFFNISRPAIIMKVISEVNLPYVVSPIYVDYSFYKDLKSPKIHRWISKWFGLHGIEYFKIMGKYLLKKEKLEYLPYIWKGQKACIKHIVQKAAILLPNSLHEQQRMENDLKSKLSAQVVCNGVNMDLFNVDYEHTNRKSKQICCVAAIEPRKNQLNLIRAIKRTEYTLILIGSPSPNHSKYYNRCKEEANEQVEFKGQLSQKELVRYYLESEMHCMPTWFETCGLSSLEAGILGCKVIATKKGDQEDYLKGFAEYCNPDSVESILDSIQRASRNQYSDEFRIYIQNNYTWSLAGEQTYDAYKNVLR